MKRAVMILVLVLAASCAYGAGEMGKLDFLIGEWKGEAWMQRGPGKPEMFVQTIKANRKVTVA